MAALNTFVRRTLRKISDIFGEEVKGRLKYWAPITYTLDTFLLILF
jgi:hypothetical protein